MLAFSSSRIVRSAVENFRFTVLSFLPLAWECEEDVVVVDELEGTAFMGAGE